MQRTNPNVVYALVANTSNGLKGVYRLDNQAGAWKTVSGAPAALFGPSFPQGDYDLTIAVDPNNANRVFMGGSYVGVNDASIYRGVVSPSGSAYSMAATWVGSGAHPDVHVVALRAGRLEHALDLLRRRRLQDDERHRRRARSGACNTGLRR